jgi:apolipoprotein N-acyltransferase
MNRKAFLPALSGLLLFLSFPPVSWDFLVWVALLPLFAALRGSPDARTAAHHGAVAGLVFYPLSLPWMFKIFGPFAAGFWCVFSLWVALFAALAWLSWGPADRPGLLRGCLWALSVSVFWTGLEYFRSEIWWLNNAWLGLGFSQADRQPFLQLCSIGGVYGLSFLIVFVNACASLLFIGRRAGPVIAGSALLVFGWGGTVLLRRDAAAGEGGRSVSVALVQDENADPDRMAAMSRAKASGADLLVWPEYGVLVQKGQEESYVTLLAGKLKDVGAVSVIGSFTSEGEGRRRKSENFAWVLSPEGGLLGRYDKLHPIPYVEKGLVPNPDPRPIDTPAGRLGVQICYDLDFENGSRRLAARGAQILVVPNIDPETWGRRQHRQHSAMAAVRAVETGRWVARAASSGESQIIDPRGRVTDMLPFGRSGVLRGSAFLRDGKTPYVATGWLLAPACLSATAMFLAFLFLLKIRRGKKA